MKQFSRLCLRFLFWTIQTGSNKKNPDGMIIILWCSIVSENIPILSDFSPGSIRNIQMCAIFYILYSVSGRSVV